MTNTNASEDRLADECRSFGGKAAELVDALERIDSELDKALDRIKELESEIESMQPA